MPAIVRRGTIPSVPDYDTGWTSTLLAESSCFLDVGCNVGYWSLLAKLSDPSRQVVAVDANPMALAIAADNLIRNGFDDVHFVLGFVSDAAGQTIDFHTTGSGAAGSRFASHVPSASETLAVKSVTLDAICSRFSVNPDFVKIDVEGAEGDVLQGARCLAASDPRILVEVHRTESRPMQEQGNLILNWARDHSFNVFYLKTGDRVDSSRSFAHRGRCHLLVSREQALSPGLSEVRQSADLSRALMHHGR